jgi:RNA polymerase sigma-70 factor (ECF subfamily)
MTGSSSDADDLVQEAFVRALEKPPKDATLPLRPWLVRVAVNLSRDELRRRKRRRYTGMWLPSPVETDTPDSMLELASPDASPEARYSLAESASFAFLVAMEALSANQRAVLLLRDVFDFTSRETADALELTEENVRITLHRARKAMTSYDADKPLSGVVSRATVDAALQRILTCLATRNLEVARDLINTETVSLSDGGGHYAAAPAPVRGGNKVLKIYMKLATRSSRNVSITLREINGTPGFIVEDPAPLRPAAPRVVVLCDLGRDGRVQALYSITAPDKLRHVKWK